jgi:hypothetical protein
MKNIKISSYKALSLIFSILTTGGIDLNAQSLLMGTIQFTRNSTLLPIHIHCGGAQITTTMHETLTPKITFEIPKSNTQTRFYLLITPINVSGKLKPSLDENIFQNTVEYLTINPQSSYAFYVLDLIKNEDDSYRWEIKKENVAENGQIPDKTIIIECYPDWIKDFKGGSGVELPTLFVDNTLIELSKSEEKFEEDLIKLQLTALDSNTMHAPTRRKIKTTGPRILIMDLIA